MRILFWLLIIVWSCFTVYGQGTIRGKVIDDETGEGLIGASVAIEGSSIGASTDLDGNFSLESIDPGTYDLIVQYISFEKKRIEGINVEEGKPTVLGTIRLSSVSLDLSEVVVSAKAVRNSEAAMVTIKRQSVNLIDGISSEMFAKTGDGDMGSAMKRVVGVTVESGKYVYVRGLGDRYSKTLLNGLSVPGLDPNRNSVQMDLFPADLVENVVVYKTFKPDLPGDFTGGLIDISTKTFPESRIFELGISLGYNSNTTFKTGYLTYSGGKLDWLGVDDGTRKGIIPATQIENIPSPVSRFDPEGSQELAAKTRELNDNWSPVPKTKMAPINHGFSISYGNQKKLFGKQVGFLAGLNYDRSYSYYKDGRKGFWVMSGSVADSGTLIADYDYTDEKSQTDVLLGAMLGVNLKLNNRNKISLLAMRTQASSDETRYLEGPKPRESPHVSIETRAYNFIQRDINSFQLYGEHVLGKNNQFQLDWESGYTLSNQLQPDLRFFSNSYNVVGGDTISEINNSYVQDPQRFTRSMKQNDLDNNISLTYEFKQWNDLKSKIKIGGGVLVKDRSSRENAIQFKKNGNEYAGDPDFHISDDNVFIFPEDAEDDNIYVVDQFQRRNNYDAQQQVYAAYAMTELPLFAKLTIVTGVRMEMTSINSQTFDPGLQTGAIDEIDLLPSFNANYSFSKKTSLRLAYGRTIARPTFREITPVTTFSFDTEPGTVGNAGLERTLVDNIDLRWEYYPDRGELYSVSVFYKNLSNPIEKNFVTTTTDNDPLITWSNVPKAMVYGIELELRKNFGFITSALEGLSLSANASVVWSRVDIPDDVYKNLIAIFPDAKQTRNLFGQSPYMVNVMLGYESKKGTEINLSYNVQGPRIAAVSFEAPNVIELPFHSLNLKVTHRFSDHFSVKLSGSNLLNSTFREVYDLNEHNLRNKAGFDQESYYLTRYSNGISVSAGLSYSF